MATRSVVAGWAERRPALLRVCAGEPLVVREEDADLFGIVKGADYLYDLIIDRQQDPDDYRLAEVIVERLCDRHGIDRIAGGTRVHGLVADVGRYLLPEAVEQARLAAPTRRGVAALLVHDVKRVPRMLAGRLPLPAATVAGDLLGRLPAWQCLWLDLDNASFVTVGGARGLREAIETGRVPVERDARSGEPIVAPVDLRAAGLLTERSTPHGLAQSTAGRIIKTLELSVDRARACGARVRGDFELNAIPPGDARMRKPKKKEDYVSVATLEKVCADLGVISQVCLWLMRLVGLRIGEAYGIRVCDFWRNERGRPFLRIDKQGGQRFFVRDEGTGVIRAVDEKAGAKAGSDRVVPIVEVLAKLIEDVIAIFHTDVFGGVRSEARLLPGIGKDDASGASTMRLQLTDALTPHGIHFTPHAMRGSLITDLEDHDVKERIRFAYVGHRPPRADVQQRSYLARPTPDQLQVAVAAITDLCERHLGSRSLRIPTAKRHGWRRGTQCWTDRDLHEQRLLEAGWHLPHIDDQDPDPLLTTEQAAQMVRCTARNIRRLIAQGELSAVEARPPHKVAKLVRTSDALALKELLSRPTVKQVAENLGVSYQRLWQLMRALDLVPAQHKTGQRIRLDESTVTALRAEQRRREDALAAGVPVELASIILELPVSIVASLLRRGELVDVTPPGQRLRLVSRDSVDRYNATFPPRGRGRAPRVVLDDVHIPFMQAARLMRVKRPTLSTLGAARQVHLISKPGSRHVYVSVRSIMSWAEREGLKSTKLAASKLLTEHADD